MSEKNVLGTALEPCCMAPMTGYYRNGFCQTGKTDRGAHVICVRVSDDFLKFSKSRGNDLSTPHPEWQFPGLSAGDKWCLCALRWVEALEAGKAPPVILEATHEKMLEFMPLEVLKKHASLH
jgi:uncharacterized protein (DUF2237 family)